MEGHSRVRNANVEHRESLTVLERLSVFVTTKIGSMGFLLILITVTITWILWNTLAPHNLRFDPFPAFVLWVFCSNVLQLSLLPLILIGQNLQSRHAETRAEADYELNTRAEKEIKRILSHLEKQDKMSIETLRRIDELQRNR